MINDTMSERLTKLGEKNKLTQTDVARVLGVSSALISAYERNPSIDRLIALADIYHTSASYILGRTIQNNEVNFHNSIPIKIKEYDHRHTLYHTYNLYIISSLTISSTLARILFIFLTQSI